MPLVTLRLARRATPTTAEQKARLAKLGKHSRGRTCLYFRRLADLDTKVLEQLVKASIANVRRRYE